MLKYSRYRKQLLRFDVVPKGPVPTLYDPDGVYPYESYVETADRPRLDSYEMVELENAHIKAVVCPDLGGKLMSLLIKSSGRETLYDPGAVKPVRILPRMAFISGGIEVSFPISHTPSQLEKVECRVEERDGRIYVWMGETEVCFGMQWTVEFSLGEDDAWLTQRMVYNNPTKKAHSYMSWSNAAVPAREDSIISYPNGRVLVHSKELYEMTWRGDAVNSQFGRMHGFFWKEKDCNAFGVYTPSLGVGLYHIADERKVPGMKLWLYGLGDEERWAHQTSLKEESYIEIQAGPVREQAEKLVLEPGETAFRTEFWIPSDKKLDIHALLLPAPVLMPWEEIPLFGAARREKNNVWREVCLAYESGNSYDVDAIDICSWPSCAFPGLKAALAHFSQKRENPMWDYYYALYLLAEDESCRECAEALLRRSGTDAAHAFLGRILRLQARYEESREAFDRIRDKAWTDHPQIVVERDLTLEKCRDALKAREENLNRIDGSRDDYVTERRVRLLMDCGKHQEAKELLLSHEFELVHQRYERTKMLHEILQKLGEPVPSELPLSLGEDELAVYGAYRLNKELPV